MGRSITVGVMKYPEDFVTSPPVTGFQPCDLMLSKNVLTRSYCMEFCRGPWVTHSGTKGIALNRLDKCGFELFEDGLVHIYPLEVETDPPRVQEREEGNLEPLETWSIA